MSPTYHLLYFVPDLLIGTRFTVGAVVQADDKTMWVEAPLLPPVSYLGPKKQRLLEMALDRLRHDPVVGLPQVAFSPEEDPRRSAAPRRSHLGNHFQAEHPREVPREEKDPAAWVGQHCLPHPPEVQEAAQVGG